MIAVATLALALTAAAPLAAVAADESWLVVRGQGPGVATLTWQRMGEAYLGASTWRIVDGDAADADPATSRFLAGSPDRHPALAALLPSVGVSVEPDGLLVAGQLVPRGTGLVLVADDPDGQGLLVIFTGFDESSAFQGFTTRIDVTRRGATLVRDGQVVGAAESLHFENAALEVVPLEILWWTAGAWHPERPVADRALAVARALEGYRFVYEAATIPEVDLLAFAAELLSSYQPTVDRALSLGFHHDAILAGLDREARLDELLGARAGPAPVVFTLVGHPSGTNARSFGVDPVSGRPAVLLNLCAFADERELDAALVHELVHTRQPAAGPRLVDQAVHEGVAARLVQQLEGADDALALMWSDDALETARFRHDELVAAFRAIASTTDAAEQAPWMVLHQAPADPPGLPDRCAYYVGWAAAGAWLAADPSRTVAGLLAADSDAVLAALP